MAVDVPGTFKKITVNNVLKKVVTDIPHLKSGKC
jgi:hypothetical protein